MSKEERSCGARVEVERVCVRKEPQCLRVQVSQVLRSPLFGSLDAVMGMILFFYFRQLEEITARELLDERACRHSGRRLPKEAGRGLVLGRTGGRSSADRRTDRRSSAFHIKCHFGPTLREAAADEGLTGMPHGNLNG